MVKVKNVYWMLAYAFSVLNEKGTQSIKTEDFDNIYDLLASIIIKSVNSQLKKGLNKEYITINEVTSNIKGKIEMSDSLKNKTMIYHKMSCNYDELSINSYMNKILKTTLKLLVKTNKLDKKYKIEIKKILIFFKDIEEIDYKTINWSLLKYNRNNITYKMLMNVCYLIINGLIISNEKGEDKFMTFIDDQRMSALYERFVKEYYRKHFPILRPIALHIDWDVNEDEMIKFLPDMKTDITLRYKDKTLIIDTKYYSKTIQTNTLYNKKTLISGNLYQIFTYVKNKDKCNTGNVEGMLLYAKTDEEITPNQEHRMGKNMIYIRTLDLSDNFKKVMEQLDNIAYSLTNNEVKKQGI